MQIGHSINCINSVRSFLALISLHIFSTWCDNAHELPNNSWHVQDLGRIFRRYQVDVGDFLSAVGTLFVPLESASNLPSLLTSDTMTTGSNFSLMNHEAPFACSSNFGARASQFPLAFPLSFPLSLSPPMLPGFCFSVLLRYLVHSIAKIRYLHRRR